MADIEAETRAFNLELEQLLAKMPPLQTVPAAVTRKARAEGKGVFPAPVVLPEGQARTVPGRHGDIPVRVFVPDEVNGVYLHIHGGGWTLGAADQQDTALWRLAQEARVAVVSVEYRLAPEDPYPAGPDDCEDAAVWLVAHAHDTFGADGMVIGGESAGAHLSVVTLLRLRDRHRITGAFRAANLVYGAYDLTMTPSQRLWGDRNLVLSTPIIAWFLDAFLPGLDSDKRSDADISPLQADLQGLPSALFTVGTEDPLLDDSLFMEARWRMAGSPTRLEVHQGAPHGFTLFPISAADVSHRSQIGFVSDAVSAPRGP